VVPDKTDVGRAGEKAGGILRITGRQEYLEISDIIYDLVQVVYIGSCSLLFGVEDSAVDENS